MLNVIQNERLALTVDTHGAQMMSMLSADGTEYLWQGNPQYWEDRAPVLFPFIGRLTNDSYRYHGKIYPMGIHGFAAASEFIVEEKSKNCLKLKLSSSEETKKQYPFDFCLQIEYTLNSNTVEISYRVSNFSKDTMPFGIAGIRGFGSL